MTPFKLGKTTIDPPIILAPMAGVSDLPFRLITRSFGCQFAFSEMISARALSHKGKKTVKMITSPPDDKPLGVQLLGSDPVFIQQAVDILNNEYQPEIIDFNAACPVKKVTNRGEGAALLKNPSELSVILKSIIRKSRVPVTVKIRSGWDDNSINTIDIAKMAEDAGVTAIMIHGRTRAQFYKGQVDYNIISQVKKAVQIPVVGSGDALCPELIKKMFDETGCNAVAIARGAIGNPWIFNQTAELLKTGITAPAPSRKEIVQTMKRHFSLSAEFHGERIGVIVFRKFFHWYTKAIPGISPLRDRAFRAKTAIQIAEVIEDLADDTSRQNLTH